MSDEKALIAAINAHPLEDTPRLVYADWLQENGQPERAEFIRVQCELAHLSYWDESPKKLTLLQTEKRLKKQYGAVWRTEVPGSNRQVTFSRGFVRPSRRYSTTAFLRLRVGDFDAAPQWEITLLDVSRASRPVFTSPLLSRLVEFDLRMGKVPPEDLLTWLADATHLRHLQKLSVGGLAIAPSVLNEFLRSAVATPLESLWLNYFHSGPYRLDGAVLRVIADSPIARNLRALGLTLAPGRAFSEGPFPWHQFPHLEWLALDYSELGDDGLRSLLAPSGAPATLRRLDLQYNELTDDGAKLLAEWPGGAKLQHLVVVSNEIGEPGVRHLQDSPHLNDLKYLTWRW